MGEGIETRHEVRAAVRLVEVPMLILGVLRYVLDLPDVRGGREDELLHITETLRKGLEGMEEALGQLDAPSYRDHYRTVVETVDELVTLLREILAEGPERLYRSSDLERLLGLLVELVRHKADYLAEAEGSVLRMRAFLSKHGKEPLECHLVRFLTSEVLLPSVTKLAEELKSLTEVAWEDLLTVLAEVVGEPYHEEVDEERAYRWLLSHARG